jgi:tetratricopeptide (TPR) repeat protein
MMTFRCLSSLLILTLLAPQVALARPVKHVSAEAKALAKTAKQNAHEAAVVAKQAKAYYQQKQFALAAELYHRAYELNPARPEFLYGVGRSEQMAGHIPQARTALESLRELLPPKHPLQAKAAKSLVEMQDVAVHTVEVIPPPVVVLPVAPTPVEVVALPLAPTPVAIVQLPQPPPTIVKSESPHPVTTGTMLMGGALIVTGIALAIVAEIDRSALAADLGVIRGSEAATRQQTVNSLSTGSVIAVAAGAGAMALGLYWRMGETAKSPVLSATPSTVQLSWRF